MFWMALVFLSLSWVLTKFGVLSATVSFLTIAIKLLLVLGLLGCWSPFSSFGAERDLSL